MSTVIGKWGETLVQIRVNSSSILINFNPYLEHWRRESGKCFGLEKSCYAFPVCTVYLNEYIYTLLTPHLPCDVVEVVAM